MKKSKEKPFSLERVSAAPPRPPVECRDVVLPEYEFVTDADQVDALIAAWEFLKLIPLCHDPKTGDYWDGVVSFKDPRKLLNYLVRRHRAGEFSKKNTEDTALNG